MSNCLYAGGNEESPTTTCPMVLRSACHHRRSSSPLTQNSFYDCSHINLKCDQSNGTNLSSISESSSHFTSIKTKSEYSDAQKTSACEKYDATVKSSIVHSTSHSTTEKSICGFSIFSGSDDTAYQNFLNRDQGLCSIYSGSTDNNNSQSVEKIDAMSRTQRYTRSSVTSVRALSGSESENEITSVQTRAKRSPSVRVQSNHSFTSRHSGSESSKSSYQASTTPNTGSLLLNELSQQHSAESFFVWLRWLVWRYTYLKILKVKDLDVWILSRIHTFGKFRTCIFAILFPLFLWLLYCGSKQVSCELVAAPVHALNSSFSFMKNLFQSLSYVPQDEETSSPACENTSSNFLLTNLFAMSGYLSSLFQKSETELSAKSASSVPHSEPPYQFHKEDVKSLVLEVWNEEKSELIKQFNVDQLQSKSYSSPLMDTKESDLKIELENLQTEYKSLTGDILKLQRNTLENAEGSKTLSDLTAEQNEKLHQLHWKISQMEEKINGFEHLMLSLKDCCSKQFKASDFLMAFETHLTSALKNITSESPSKSYDFFRKWLESKFLVQESLKSEIQSAFESLKKDSDSLDEEAYTKQARHIVEGIVSQHMESIKRDFYKEKVFSGSSAHIEAFSLDEVQKAIREAIKLYDADKNGLVDYALESGGGSVLGTRCSETYLERNARFSVLGLPLWYSSNSPRTAIQPAVHPGDCWAFKGTQGFLVIQLSTIVRPTGFSLEHIPVNLSPTGNIDSAPKEFSVWGLETEKDSVGVILGNYVYDKEGEPLQYFETQESKDQHFSFVELKVHSNHGNPEYTCLYRFRVHGRRT